MRETIIKDREREKILREIEEGRRRVGKFKRLVSLVVLSCFVYSFILFEPLFAVVQKFQDSKLKVQNEELVTNEKKEENNVYKLTKLPYKFGRVVDGRYKNSDSLVVFVQDLHCHPEVQRNIYEIIKFFDENYRLEKVFVEGMPEGKVELKVLSSLPKSIKKDVIENLISKGMISAAEYYSAINENNKLYGLENWDVYYTNFQRANFILTNKDVWGNFFPLLDNKIKILKTKYLSSELKRIVKFLDDTKNNDSKFFKYYSGLVGLAKKYNISYFNYPNLEKYLTLLKIEQEINHNKLVKEFDGYYRDLGYVLPVDLYTKLTEKFKDETRIEENYLTLLDITKKYNIDIIKKYPNLSRFFNYIEINYSLNPINLMLEEKLFLKEVLSKAAKNVFEREILFIDEMVGYLKNYLELKITHNEFVYFRNNIADFKFLLNKYFGDEVEELLVFLSKPEVFQFYSDNVRRDKIFYENIVKNLSLTNSASGNEKKVLDTKIYENFNYVVEKLPEFRSVNLVIAGGFHLGVTKLLSESGISTLVVVPNATTKFDDTIYEKLLTQKIELRDMLKSGLAPVAIDFLVSMGLKKEEASPMVEALIYSICAASVEKEITLEEIKRNVEDWILTLSKTDERFKGLKYLTEIKIANDTIIFNFLRETEDGGKVVLRSYYLKVEGKKIVLTKIEEDEKSVASQEEIEKYNKGLEKPLVKPEEPRRTFTGKEKVEVGFLGPLKETVFDLIIPFFRQQLTIYLGINALKWIIGVATLSPIISIIAGSVIAIAVLSIIVSAVRSKSPLFKNVLARGVGSPKFLVSVFLSLGVLAAVALGWSGLPVLVGIFAGVLVMLDFAKKHKITFDSWMQKIKTERWFWNYQTWFIILTIFFASLLVVFNPFVLPSISALILSSSSNLIMLFVSVLGLPNSIIQTIEAYKKSKITTNEQEKMILLSQGFAGLLVNLMFLLLTFNNPIGLSLVTNIFYSENFWLLVGKMFGFLITSHMVYNLLYLKNWLPRSWIPASINMVSSRSVLPVYAVSEGSLKEINDVRIPRGSSKSIFKVLQDPSRKLWLFKRYITGYDYRTKVDALSVVLSKRLGLRTYLEAYPVIYSGEEGTLFRYVPESSSLWELISYDEQDVLKCDFTSLTREQIKIILQEQVLDWLISNHDSHGGNFLIDKQGNIYAIDKSQGFEYLGEDILSTDYNPNRKYNGSSTRYMPIYNILLKHIQSKGGIKCKDGIVSFEEAYQSVKEIIDRVESIPDEEYRDLITGVVSSKYVAGSAQYQNFISLAIARKRSVRKDFDVLYGSIKPSIVFSIVPRPKNGNYISTEQLVEWKDRFSSSVSESKKDAFRALAEILSENIKYVSQPEFEKRLEEVITMFNNEIKDRPYIVVLPSDRTKSNWWVYALALEKGLRPPVRIFELDEIVSEDVLKIEGNVMVEDILFIDDSSYSGVQNVTFFDRFIGKIEFYCKNRGVSINNFRFHFLIPFMSNEAFIELRDYCSEKKFVFEELIKIYFREKIPTIEEIIEVARNSGRYPKYIYSIWQEFLSNPSVTGISLTYFEHKFPDYLSFLSINGKPIFGRIPYYDNDGKLMSFDFRSSDILRIEKPPYKGWNFEVEGVSIVEGKRSKVGSILNNSLKRIFGEWSFWYNFYTVVIAPVWESLVFQVGGVIGLSKLVLPVLLVVGVTSPILVGLVSVLLVSGIFVLSHQDFSRKIVDWITGAKKVGLDSGDKKFLGATFLFSLPVLILISFQIFNPLAIVIASLVTIGLHSLHNAVVLKGWLGRDTKVATVIQNINTTTNEDIQKRYTKLISETGKILVDRYGENSQVVKDYDSLVKSPLVSDLFVEAVYTFVNYPQIGNVINRIRNNLHQNNPGAGVELLRAYELHKKGYKVLVLGLAGKKGHINKKGKKRYDTVVDFDIVAFDPASKKYYFYEVKASKGIEGYDEEKLNKVENFLIEMTQDNGLREEEIVEVRNQFYFGENNENFELIEKIIGILRTASLDRSNKRINSSNGEIILETLSGVEEIGILNKVIRKEFLDYNNTVIVNRTEAQIPKLDSTPSEKTSEDSISILRTKKSNMVDRAKLQRWVENFARALPLKMRAKYRQFAQLVADNITHITQEQFEEQLRESVSKFNKMIGDRPYVVVFIYDKNKPKSNEWVYYLALELGLKPASEIVYVESSSLLSGRKFRLEGKEIKDILYIDDAAYTGKQVASNMTRWTLQEDQMIHFVIPFMSKKGKDEIEKVVKTRAKKFSFCPYRTIETVREIFQREARRRGVKMSDIIPQEVEEYVDLDSTLTYFDHKIPDGISFLSFADTLEKDKKKKSLLESPFIAYDNNGFVKFRNEGESLLEFPGIVPPYKTEEFLRYREYMERREGVRGSSRMKLGEIFSVSKSSVLQPLIRIVRQLSLQSVVEDSWVAKELPLLKDKLVLYLVPTGDYDTKRVESRIGMYRNLGVNITPVVWLENRDMLEEVKNSLDAVDISEKRISISYSGYEIDVSVNILRDVYGNLVGIYFIPERDIMEFTTEQEKDLFGSVLRGEVVLRLRDLLFREPIRNDMGVGLVPAMVIGDSSDIFFSKPENSFDERIRNNQLLRRLVYFSEEISNRRVSVDRESLVRLGLEHLLKMYNLNELGRMSISELGKVVADISYSQDEFTELTEEEILDKVKEYLIAGSSIYLSRSNIYGETYYETPKEGFSFNRTNFAVTLGEGVEIKPEEIFDVVGKFLSKGASLVVLKEGFTTTIAEEVKKGAKVPLGEVMLEASDSNISLVKMLLRRGLRGVKLYGISDIGKLRTIIAEIRFARPDAVVVVKLDSVNFSYIEELLEQGVYLEIDYVDNNLNVRSLLSSKNFRDKIFLNITPEMISQLGVESLDGWIEIIKLGVSFVNFSVTDARQVQGDGNIFSLLDSLKLEKIAERVGIRRTLDSVYEEGYRKGIFLGRDRRVSSARLIIDRFQEQSLVEGRSKLGYLLDRYRGLRSKKDVAPSEFRTLAGEIEEFFEGLGLVGMNTDRSRYVSDEEIGFVVSEYVGMIQGLAEELLYRAWLDKKERTEKEMMEFSKLKEFKKLLVISAGVLVEGRSVFKIYLESKEEFGKLLTAMRQDFVSEEGIVSPIKLIPKIENLEQKKYSEVVALFEDMVNNFISEINRGVLAKKYRETSYEIVGEEVTSAESVVGLIYMFDFLVDRYRNVKVDRINVTNISVEALKSIMGAS